MILLLALPMLPIVWLPVIALAARQSRRAAGFAAAAAMLSGLAALALLAPQVFAGEVITTTLPWLPEYGLDLALRLDGLGLLFVLLIDGIGLLIVIYAYYYLPVSDRLGRFYMLLLAFAAGMLGIVLAENILLLVLAWEVTSLASFLLIAYKFREREARIAARTALAVTGGGGLALLAGMILLGHIAGSFALSDILVRGDIIRADPLYPAMLVLVLLGVFTKSAQFPFHVWLPDAMAAPTPVSAYLHSATLVKAGVFVLARFYPVLSGTELWFTVVTTTGAITFVVGAYRALFRNDFKGLLAYSTISHLGLITMLFGLGTALAPVAAVFHIINHAIFKASLFMVAGIVDHECGTRDMRRVNGMFKVMPITATLGILAAGAMAGVPFLNGFLSKEMFFTEAIAHPLPGVWRWLLPAVATVGGILSVGYSARFVHDVFFNGDPIDLPRVPHEPVNWIRLPVEVLVGLVLLVGLLPQLVVGPILRLASGAVLMAPVPDFTLALWHGFNLALVMSIAALGGGAFYYLRRDTLYRLHERLALRLPSPVAFERAYAGTAFAARAILRTIDRQSVRQYAALLFGFAIALAAFGWLTAADTALAGPVGGTPIEAGAIIAFAALLIGLAGTLRFHQSGLIALIFLSVIGLVVILVFVRFAAPDLALTQVAVEVATLMLLVLALRYLPRPAPALPANWRDAVLAIAAGTGAGLLCFAMLTRPFDTISGFYTAQALPGGGGTNVVNVILVDFRGFDTLGEIAVLAMAALGVQVLLGGLKLTPVTTSANDSRFIMLRMLIQPLVPLALAVAAYIFLRGHNLPGGGFVAGMITAMALMMHHLAGSSRPLRFDFTHLLAAGLLVAAATGIASLAFGQSFLKSAHTSLEIPFLGHIELASAMVFDLGIGITVFAALMLILTELADLRHREPG